MFVDLPKNQELRHIQCLTIEDVAKLLRVTKQHVRNEIDRGNFPHGFKLGHSRRWSVESIRQYLSEKESA